jgi:hypothetical protein
MSMKTIASYLVILVSLAVVVLGGHAYVFASQEASTIECDNGVVNIGDFDVDVQAKCGEPSTKRGNVWVYNFGPDEPIYTVIFDNGKVARILEDESGS